MRSNREQCYKASKRQVERRVLGTHLNRHITEEHVNSDSVEGNRFLNVSLKLQNSLFTRQAYFSHDFYSVRKEEGWGGGGITGSSKTIHIRVCTCKHII